MNQSLNTARASRRGVGMVLTLLLIMLIPSLGLADQYLQVGDELLTVPPPNGFVDAGDEAAAGKFAPMVRAMSSGHRGPAQLYLTPDALSHPKEKSARLFNVFMLVPMDVDNDKVKQAFFDADPAQLDRMAHQAAEHLQLKSSVSLLNSESQGVFRHEPWGAFLSFRTVLGDSSHRMSIAVRYGVAIIQVHHQLLTLISLNLNDTDAAQTDAQNTMSAWADAIRLANPEPATVKSSKLYKLAPWLILLTLGLLAYFLLFRKKDEFAR